MARRAFRAGGAGAGEVSFNMTPMIDCTFQLIIFFILTSQVASQELAKLNLAKPVESIAQKTDNPFKVVVNVTSAEDDYPPGATIPPSERGRAKDYVVVGQTYANSPAGLDALQHDLEKRMKEHKAQGRGPDEFFVEIRGDKRVHFVEMLPVMACATAAGVSKMNLTALVK